VHRKTLPDIGHFTNSVRALLQASGHGNEDLLLRRCLAEDCLRNISKSLPMTLTKLK